MDGVEGELGRAQRLVASGVWPGTEAFVSNAVRVGTKRKVDPHQERVMEMAQCEVCGNEYDKGLGIPSTHAPVMLTVSLV